METAQWVNWGNNIIMSRKSWTVVLTRKPDERQIEELGKNLEKVLYKFTIPITVSSSSKELVRCSSKLTNYEFRSRKKILGAYMSAVLTLSLHNKFTIAIMFSDSSNDLVICSRKLTPANYKFRPRKIYQEPMSLCQDCRQALYTLKQFECQSRYGV